MVDQDWPILERRECLKSPRCTTSWQDKNSRKAWVSWQGNLSEMSIYEWPRDLVSSRLDLGENSILVLRDSRSRDFNWLKKFFNQLMVKLTKQSTQTELLVNKIFLFMVNWLNNWLIEKLYQQMKL